MANASKAFKAMADKARENAKAETIVTAAVAAGILDKVDQKWIYDSGKKKAMLAMYQLECIRQAQPKAGKTRGSTASPNKYLEVAQRVARSLEAGSPIAVRDFACRNCQKDDMTINHRPLEIKSGRGEVVKGVDLLDTLDMLEKWIESDKLFIWFYDLSEWDYTAADAMEKMDDLPYVFTTCRQLAEWMTEYKGDLDRWFCITDTAVNMTELKGKRKAYVEGLSHGGYDWLTFRQTGELVEK